MEILTDLDQPYHNVVVFMLSIVAGIVFSLVAYLLIKRVRRIYDIDKEVLSKIKVPLFLVIMILLLGPAIDYLNLHYSWIDQIRHVSLIFAGAWLLINVVAVIRSAIMNQYDLTKEDNLEARKIFTQIRVFERVAVVIIVVVAIGLALMTFESIRQIGLSLLTSAGIAGIIVGLAAQRLIGNILAGLQIALTQPIRMDDVVIVEGEWGKIEEIKLTYVVVNIWDKRRLVVPATYFIEKPFQNWTRTTSEILGTVFIHTDYRMPIDPIREELDKILKNTPLWDGKVNVVQVTDSAKATMEIRALVSAKNSGSAWDLRVMVREKLIAFMQKEFPEMLPRTRIEIDDKSN
ncbi:MAG: mechanosensitive ion channel domain-containing protein [Bacteroidota bacterium]